MPQTVLIVDDEPALRRAMARELRQEFSVSLAGSPMDALSLLNEGNGICAVVSDLMMGGPVGIDFLEEVRRRAPACARILVSGTMLEREIREVLQSGAIQKFVSKPWQPGELLTAVRGAVDACPRAGE